MKLIVEKSRLSGEILIPGSKSHTIRAVALALAANGTSVIKHPLISSDTLSSLAAAEKLGAQIERAEQDAQWIIHGTNRLFSESKSPVGLANSGTGIKFFAALASHAGHQYVFDGDDSLRTRPMQPLLDALSQLGVKTFSRNGKCPFSIQGPLHGGRVTVNGKSSQYVSAVLFAASLAKEDSEIQVVDINEQPYIGITLSWLKRVGIRFEAAPDYTHFHIPGGQIVRPFEWTIPADFSTAAFPLTAAAVTGSTIDIRNLDFDDPQGDKAVFSYLERMGMSVLKMKNGITRVSLPTKLTGTELDLNATPDALPALAAAAAFAGGKTVIRNVAQARIKETDRIACMTSELRKMGVCVEELPDGMIITGGPVHGAEVNSYKDHRIAMALAVAGLGAEGKTIIADAECAAVTYPGFIQDFKKLQADFKTE